VADEATEDEMSEEVPSPPDEANLITVLACRKLPLCLIDTFAQPLLIVEFLAGKISLYGA